MIYCDYNATTPVDETVLEAMLPYLTTYWGNASSSHRWGKVARMAIDTARQQVANLVAAHPNQIIFTSGGTEANNLALKGVMQSLPKSRQLAVSAIEHPSVLETAKQLANQGWQLKILPVDQQGLLIPPSPALKPTLASIMLANNETGVIQDLDKIVAWAKANQVILHSDAVQALGKIPINFIDSGLDLMSISAHKIYGPKGVGALVINRQIDLGSILTGGGQEQNWRSGTENVAAIVGFGQAAELALAELARRQQQLKELRAYLLAQLKSIEVTIFSPDPSIVLANTISLGIPNIDGATLVLALDKKGIAVSAGSACGSEHHRASHVLLAMGIAIEQANTVIRISLGKNTTKVEIDQVIAVLKTMVKDGI